MIDPSTASLEHSKKSRAATESSTVLLFATVDASIVIARGVHIGGVVLRTLPCSGWSAIPIFPQDVATAPTTGQPTQRPNSLNTCIKIIWTFGLYFFFLSVFLFFLLSYGFIC
jgi:hypothetical protein